MKSQQMFGASSNGDVSCEYFLAWLFEKQQESYVEGYTDCLQDDDKTREFFVKECG